MRFGANLERRLLRSVFGFEIDDPYRPLPDRGFWARLWARLADPATWKDAVYLNLLFPLGLVYLTVTVTLWSLAIGLVSMPAWYWAIPGYPKRFEAQGQAHVIVDTWWKAALALLVGLAIALVTPPILRALAATHRWIARGLLGASEKAKLRARAARLASSRAKAVGSAEAERRRIERDLHDGAQARLVALAMELGRAKEKFETDPAAAQVLVEHAHEEAKATIAELRNLARGIHPAVLTDRGLDAALSSLAARSPVPVRVHVRVGRRPAPEIESIGGAVNLCRACSEDFVSVTVFDRHRVGKHAYRFVEGMRMDPAREDGRRCLDVEEMTALGWREDRHGRWQDPARSAEVASRLRGCRSDVARRGVTAAKGSPQSRRRDSPQRGGRPRRNVARKTPSMSPRPLTGGLREDT
jgi:Putative sensor/Histidine kinase